MTNAESLRGVGGVGSFVGRIAGSADCECRNIAAEMRDGPTNEARVDAAAQQRADWNVGEQASLNGADEEAFCLFDGLGKRRLFAGWYRRTPVFACADSARGPFDECPCRNLADAAINRTVVSDVPEFEKIGDREVVDLVRKAAGAQSTGGRGESDVSVVIGVKKRFDAQAIANEEERAFTIVPQRNRKHAANSFEQTVESPRVVAVHEDFRIGVTLETVACGF